ncbi:MAG: hypothetical protein HC769_26060 [Cyanobacteria bacterium CRU_2_1]|nr:hypothetical protein [Cyanobacteria bacterium CRU_2_1]
MHSFPLLGEKIADRWNLSLRQELNMTSDSHLFKQQSGEGRRPLYEGKMIHQFTHQHAEPRYWVDEDEARKAALGRNEDVGQELDYQEYRIALRAVGENTNSRNFIASVIPRNTFCGHSLLVSRITKRQYSFLIYACTLLNSFVLDYAIKMKIARNVSIFQIYQLPVPRLQEGDRYFSEIVDRAAKLICTTPEFDDLAAEVGLRPSSPQPPSPKAGKGGEDAPAPLAQLGRGVGGEGIYGVTDEAERAKLRAELDGMIAHLYGLTEAEFQHILSTFPIVPAETKQAALEVYRTFTPTVGDQEILALIAQGESAQLEFKSTARWNLKDGKKDRTMEEVILKTVAAFLNAEGGTLLIGVEDDGNVLGLQPDYQTLQKKNRDGFELWLMNDLLLKELGKELAPFISVSFHIIDHKEVCRVCLGRAPQPVYINIRNPKSGQLEECLFIRSGNLTSKLDTPRAIANYTKTRWG